MRDNSKPHIRRISFSAAHDGPMWLCSGLRAGGYGTTPVNAYAKWREFRLRDALGQWKAEQWTA
jgi:hypothetical protein